MKKSKEVFRLMKSHGPVIEGVKITLSAGKCIALLTLVEKAREEYEATDLAKKDNAIDFTTNDDKAEITAVLATIKVLEAFIAPVLHSLDLQTTGDVVECIIEESKTSVEAE